MAEQIMIYAGDERNCAERNDELEEFHVNWNDLQELKQSERSRTRRTLYKHCTVTQSNIMDFSNNSIAMIPDNIEGLMRKNTIHIQRKNCGSRNAEEKHGQSHGSIGI